jgi:hypothetical protein
MSRRREREPPACVWVTPPPPDLECSVCSEVFTDPVTLACGHTFCRACALAWFTSPAKRCPVARCAASARSKPQALPTQYALKGVVESLRVYCRFGVREDERGGWKPDPEGCLAQLSRGEAAAHEASCEHALEVCPFAGCGAQRRRRDADAHDAEMAVAHARGERDARLALEASARRERDARLDALARLVALEARLAAVAAAGGVGAARAVTGAVRRATLNGHTESVCAIGWHPDGTVLVSGGADKTLKLWDVATLECAATMDGHGGSVYDCCWSPDGRTLASASGDETVKLWNMETRTCVALLEHGECAVSCTWSPDGRWLASTSTDDFKVWDVEARSCIATLDGVYHSCAWCPDGSKVLIGGDSGAVVLWDVATRSCVATLEDHTEPVCACAWSPDGLRFVTGSYDCTLKLWSAAAPFSCTATLLGHTGFIRSCAWSSNGLTIASCSCYPGTVRLWDAASGNCCATMECDSAVRKCCWSPDGNALAVCCSDGTLVLYNVQRA